MRVLLVERSPFLRLVLREVLSRANHQIVAECERITDAVALAGTLGPEVILLDLEGSEWPAEVGALHRGVPAARIVVIGSPGACPEETRGDIEVLLRKPFTPEAVLAAIRSYSPADRVLPA